MNAKPFVVCAAAALALVAAPRPVSAHCDSLDGPVVKAAQRALDTRDVNHVLIWVLPADEAEIRAAFEQTLTVRAIDPRAKALVDKYFFETVVRVHRAGEGAPYTGLKPVGTDVGPAIPAADRALADGSPKALARLLMSEIEAGLLAQFARALAARTFAPQDVEAGRRFVRAYVEYVHYVERLHDAAKVEKGAHLHETAR